MEQIAVYLFFFLISCLVRNLLKINSRNWKILCFIMKTTKKSLVQHTNEDIDCAERNDGFGAC